MSPRQSTVTLNSSPTRTCGAGDTDGAASAASTSRPIHRPRVQAAGRRDLARPDPRPSPASGVTCEGTRRHSSICTLRGPRRSMRNQSRYSCGNQKHCRQCRLSSRPALMPAERPTSAVANRRANAETPRIDASLPSSARVRSQAPPVWDHRGPRIALTNTARNTASPSPPCRPSWG